MMGLFHKLAKLGARPALQDLDVLLTLFTMTKTIVVPFRPRQSKPLGVAYDTCPHLYRCKLIVPKTLRKLGKYTKPSTYDGAYVLAVNGKNVFSVSDVTRTLAQLARANQPPTHIDLLLAMDKSSELFAPTAPAMRLSVAHIRHLASVTAEAGEGTLDSAAPSPSLSSPRAGEGFIRGAARRRTSVTPLSPSSLEFLPPSSYSQPEEEDLLILDKGQILLP